MQERVAGRVALIAGATGLVGREILATILADDNTTSNRQHLRSKTTDKLSTLLATLSVRVNQN